MSTAGTSFYVSGGTLRQDAPSYVERQADQEGRGSAGVFPWGRRGQVS